MLMHSLMSLTGTLLPNCIASRVIDKFQIYQERKYNTTTGWLLFLLLGWSYGSMNRMAKQVFFYITLGGLGLWTIYRLFTLNGAMKKYNKKIAIELGFTNKELVQLGLI